MKKFFLIFISLIFLTSCNGNMNKEYTNKNSSVVYEIFVGSFYDSNNDGIGDLEGITNQFDYLQSLGVGDVWLTPIHSSDSYHKYDVLDYYSIDKSFGTMEDFEHLIDEGNKRNIGIIMDLVLNHTGVNHPWFVEAKNNILNNTCNLTDKCDYYNFKKDKESNTAKLSDSIYYEAVFGSHMPDLNLENENVRNEIKEIVKFWLDKGVKGFRLDAALHYYGSAEKNNEFLSWLNKTVKEIKPDAFIVGEVWSDEATIIEHYKSKIDSLFNFPASFTDGKIVNAIRDENGNSLANWIVENNCKIHEINNMAINGMFLSNHDQGRSGAFFADDYAKWKLMINTLILSPGIPYIYYGEEIGMLGSGIDENKRLAMPWGYKNNMGECEDPKNSDYINNFNSSVVLQLKDKNSILNYYKNIIYIRNNYTSWINGDYEIVDFGDKAIYGVKHTNNDESIIVVHNYSSEDKIVSINDNIRDIQVVNNNSTIKDGKLNIQAMSSAILEIER